MHSTHLARGVAPQVDTVLGVDQVLHDAARHYPQPQEAEPQRRRPDLLGLQQLGNVAHVHRRSVLEGDSCIQMGKTTTGVGFSRKLVKTVVGSRVTEF